MKVDKQRKRLKLPTVESYKLWFGVKTDDSVGMQKTVHLRWLNILCVCVFDKTIIYVKFRFHFLLLVPL